MNRKEEKRKCGNRKGQHTFTLLSGDDLPAGLDEFLQDLKGKVLATKRKGKKERSQKDGRRMKKSKPRNGAKSEEKPIRINPPEPPRSKSHIQIFIQFSLSFPINSSFFDSDLSSFFFSFPHCPFLLLCSVSSHLCAGILRSLQNGINSNPGVVVLLELGQGSLSRLLL